jgi:hypothetical protein
MSVPRLFPPNLVSTSHALHLTVNHPTHHHISLNIYPALTQIRPSNTVLTKGLKLWSPAEFSKSQKLRGALGSG